MIRVASDRLVEDYLRRLETAAAHLPRARRVELVAEIREHIRTAIAEETVAGDAATLDVLDRLGDPEEIVSAVEQPVASPVRTRWIDVLAVIGLLLPVLGWAVGSVLVLISTAWSRRDKVIGLLLLAVPILALGIGLTVTSASQGMDERLPVGDERPVGVREEGPPADVGLAGLVLFASGVPSSIYLAWRLRSDAGVPPARV